MTPDFNPRIAVFFGCEVAEAAKGFLQDTLSEKGDSYFYVSLTRDRGVI